MKDYGTGLDPNGTQITLIECDKCGDMRAAGGTGHENPPVSTSTDRHKMALAK